MVRRISNLSRTASNSGGASRKSAKESIPQRLQVPTRGYSAAAVGPPTSLQIRPKRSVRVRSMRPLAPVVVQARKPSSKHYFNARQLFDVYDRAPRSDFGIAPDFCSPSHFGSSSHTALASRCRN